MSKAPFAVAPNLARRAWLLYAAAVASSLPTLWFFLVGEEGILVNSSLEMAQRGDWLRLWLYGADAVHGVFANWLIMLICGVAGWERAPGAGRAIMIGSTALGGLMLAFLVHRLYRNAALAAFAAALAVTFGDILFYRGWLGYRDPLLGMLVFGAIAALWIAVETRRTRWLVATLVLATMAFLTKGLIAYAFVGAATLVFLWRRETRTFLLRPIPLMLAAATLSAPFAWAYWVGGDQAHNSRMTAEIAAKLMWPDALAYLWKITAYPLETLLRLAPVSLLVLWWLWRERRHGTRVANCDHEPGVSSLNPSPSPGGRRERRVPARAGRFMGRGTRTFDTLLADQRLRTALAIAGVAFVPFWLAPQSHFRYLLPILPLLALALAVAVCRLGEGSMHSTLRWMWAMVALKFVLAVVVFPIYQHKVRGENYALAARAVLQRSADFPLYSNDVSAAGLSVTAYMNMQRLPRRALTFAPARWDSGFTISNLPDTALGRIAAQYPLGGDTLYLLCRGAACDAPAQH